MSEKEFKTETESTDSEKEKSYEQEQEDQFLERYKLRENYEYETEHGYKYETDQYGRIKKCEGTLVLDKENKADPVAQRMVGGEDRHTGKKIFEGKIEYDPDDKDDGSHLIARQFGGSPEVDNLVPMNYHINRGEYKVMENNWEKTLQEKDENGEQKYDVKVEISIKYEGDSERPKSIYVKETVVDRTTGEEFRKLHRFKNEVPNNE